MSYINENIKWQTGFVGFKSDITEAMQWQTGLSDCLK